MLAVRGVAAVIFGLLALIWPQITLLALVLVFGAYPLVDGVFSLVAAARGRELAGGSRGWLILEGLLGIAAGIAELGGLRGAWFKDPEGNILSVVQPPPA